MSSAGLSFARPRGKATVMEKTSEALAREERLAAKLRENLKRRKAQARAHDSRALDSDDNAALPKAPPEG